MSQRNDDNELVAILVAIAIMLGVISILGLLMYGFFTLLTAEY